jgi:ubiquinone biosynthesis protein
VESKVVNNEPTPGSGDSHDAGPAKDVLKPFVPRKKYPKSEIAENTPSPLRVGPQLHKVGAPHQSTVRLLPPSTENRFAMFLRHAVQFAGGAIGILLRHGNDAGRFGHLVRQHVVEMGGLWVRLGILLGDHRNVLPEAFCDPLLRIHDRTDGFTFDQVRRVVESELGRKLEDAFEHFDTGPLAATTTAQTHRAFLRRERIWVAVKVQRPGIAGTMRADLRIQRRVAPLLGWLTGISKARWEEAFWQIDQNLEHDLDFRLEAAHMKRTTRSLRKHGVLVPRVFLAYSGRTVVTKEFVVGVSVMEYLKAREADPDRAEEWLLENGLDTKRVGIRLYHSLLRQVLEEDLFNTNWNPMNIIMLRNNWVTIVDFFAMYSVDRAFQKKIVMLHRAIAQREFRKAADYFVLIGPPLPPTHDSDKVVSEIVHSLRIFDIRARAKLITYSEKSLSVSFGEIGRILTRDGAPPTLDFLRIDRAFRILDLSLCDLIPRADIMKILGSYWRKADRRAIGDLISLDNLRKTLTSTAGLLSRAPGMLAEQWMFQTELFRKRARVFQMTAGKVAEGIAFVFSVFNTALAAILVILIGGWALRAYPQYEAYASMFGESAMRILRAVPPFRSPQGIVSLLAVLFVLRGGMRLRGRFTQKDTSGHDRTSD